MFTYEISTIASQLHLGIVMGTATHAGRGTGFAMVHHT